MQHAIDKVYGKVLCFGLGLGYFAYMASLKQEVTSITIIEKDPQIIELFTSSLLPQFEYKSKIVIIQADAFEYAKSHMASEAFDSSFVDLWHDANDGLPMYLAMKAFEDKSPSTSFSYWLEASFLAVLRRIILTLIEDELNGIHRTPFLPATHPMEKIMNRCYDYLKAIPIKGYEEIQALLDPASLQKIAKELHYSL